MMKYIEKIKFLFLVFMILALISSCSEQPDVKQEDTDTVPDSIAEETESKYLDALSDTLDFNGRTIRFFLADALKIDLGIRSITASEDAADVVDAAVYNRNLTISDRLNVEIELRKTTDEGALGTELRTFVAAGSDEYDVVAGYQAYSVGVAAEGLLIDLAEDGYIDFDAPYWAGELIDNMSYNKLKFWGTGDITLRYIGGVSVTYVNERILTDYYSDLDLYSIVREGQWTLDKLYELSSGIYSDLNGNSKYDDEDQYGFVMCMEDPIDAMVVGAGISYTEYDSDNTPHIKLDMERMVGVHEKLSKLLNINPNTRIVTDEDNVVLMNTFAKGNVLFTVNKLFQAEYYLREMTDNYLIIPLAKYDEAQKNYRTSTHDGVTVFGIPITAKNVSEIEMTMEAMASGSYQTVRPAYIEVALKNKYARDPGTAEMIDLVLSSTYSDFAMQYHRSINNISHIYRKTLSNASSTFASGIAKYQKLYEKQLDILISNFEKNC